MCRPSTELRVTLVMRNIRKTNIELMYHIADFLMRLRLLLFAALILALPMAASAEEQTTLRLGDSAEQAQWQTIGLKNVGLVPDGIHITTSVPGILSRPIGLSHRIDVVEILYTSPRGASISFMWRKKGSATNNYMQIPVTLQPSLAPTSIIVDLSAVGGWDPHTVSIGFQIPPGSDVIFHTIELSGWSIGEKVIESIRCFWIFDGLKAYSINFFWGPLLCTSPITRTHLFQSQPPAAHSALRVIYALLILGTAVILFRAWKNPHSGQRATIIRRVLVLFFVFWIVLDIRMGAEFLATWTYDVRSYLMQPIGKRTFRTFNFLSDFALATRGILSDQPRYVLMTPTTNFMNFMRYQTYPSAPVSPADGSGATIWLVYERPDLAFSTDGRIVQKGQPISPVGQIIHEFMDGTFVFRTTPPASATP
ncbi:MAG: hypothetical protein PeribacterA2_0120 [Candidatus Peribacter riflensis]|uniref:Uncharacterized protein n=1 Tax=Candidatus Peribacter riflensis TaxID=1735162 RepID=A0A0S1SI01_9BACT|nr:MAG: hypothetical protein PeribacterA2_0120 [Candidatus Peribacter riflensis]ALM10617.1 MAG: hypothetical protein PeribacterB2_0120 [Candidatus Peribacter riflensis]ALM11719.1 MAG: hypothetical protein PeribacterC2_0119 [Candidatus Peribacter riflensis]ALM12822.1 MAG: hypothetical protein PeribacterD1_0120 [Candidatus Peribacter riflensis]ALM13923.1 MAG: hypothetical protein PeribacterD2_0120 [Candidatus Peribacter riflensis]